MSLSEFCRSLFRLPRVQKISGRRRLLGGSASAGALSVERLEVRQLLTFYIVDFAGGGNNPLLDSNDSATHGGAGTVGDPFHMASLRGAISAANSNAGADTITVPAGTYTLSLLNAGGLNEDANATGDLDVNGSLTILGSGAASTIIQAGTNTTNGIDKVIAFDPTGIGPFNFNVSGVTIRHGRNTQMFGAADFSYTGGGIDFFGNGASTFSISNSIVTLNTNVTAYGGGMNVDSIGTGTMVTITNTVFSNNTSLMHGGGLNLFSTDSTITITGSTFSNNNTLGTGGVGAQGGGINIRASNDPGGATPSVSISNSTIKGNVGVESGGGIDMGGGGDQNLTITNTVISGNSLLLGSGSDTKGGGINIGNPAARTTTLTNVLISGNTSLGSATSVGGGLAHQGGALSVHNTTISGNSAKFDGGGVYVNSDQSPTLINTTISNNRADSDNNSTGTGGGLLKLAGAGTVTLQNTLVGGNFKGTGATANDVNGTVTANFSLIADTTGSTLAGGSANNQTGVSARLAALANNGGPTVGPTGFTAVLQTHALLVGSPALDNGSNALILGGITTDQRGTGFARILDAADADATDEVDIGALEQHPAVEEIAAQIMNEDATLMLGFNVGDADLGFDSITATSDNTTLVPNLVANLSVTGSGSARTLNISPASNKYGTANITVTINATVNGTPQSMTHTFLLTVNGLADTPSVTDATTNEDVQTTSGLVVSRNVNDGAEVTHFKITNITNGTLFQNNGSTAISNGDFITFAQANAGLRFTPAANLFSPTTTPFKFDVQASLSNVNGGLGGSAATATITVNPVADTPSVTNASTTTNVQTTTGLVISRNVVDGPEVTHFKITNITDGTLFQNNGTTPISAGDFITFAQANAGLKFTPNAAFTGTGHFTVQASTSNVDGGLGGSTVTADITVTGAAISVTGIDVQNGQTQRSYVRYLDILFGSSTGLQGLIDGGRLQLTKFDLNGLNPVNVPLTMASVSGNNIKLDFGVQGLGGNRNTNAGDGYYEIKVDTNSNGFDMSDPKKNFFRLLGDVTGNGVVDASDKNQILAANGTNAAESDTNGDGIVNYIDSSLVSRAVGRKVKNGLIWDD